MGTSMNIYEIIKELVVYIAATIGLMTLLLTGLYKGISLLNGRIKIYQYKGIYLFPPFEEGEGNTSSFYLSFRIDNNRNKPISITNIELQDRYSEKWFSPLNSDFNLEEEEMVVIDGLESTQVEKIYNCAKLPINVPASGSCEVKIIIPLSGTNFLIDSDHTTVDPFLFEQELLLIPYIVRIHLVGFKNKYVKAGKAPVGVRCVNDTYLVEEALERLQASEPTYETTILIRYEDKEFRFDYSFTGYTTVSEMIKSVDHYLNDHDCDTSVFTSFIMCNLNNRIAYEIEEFRVITLVQDYPEQKEIVIEYGGIGATANIDRKYIIQIRGDEKKHLSSPHLHFSTDKGVTFVSLPIRSKAHEVRPFKESVKIWNKYKHKDRREIQKTISENCQKFLRLYNDIMGGVEPEPVEFMFFGRRSIISSGHVKSIEIEERSDDYYIDGVG